MEHLRTQDAPQSKGSTLRHREHSDDPVDKRPPDSTDPHSQDEKRPIRRVESPSKPRAWQSGVYKPKFGGRFYRPRDQPPFYKPGFVSQKYQHFTPRDQFQHRPYPHKPYHAAPREERSAERLEKESSDGSSPLKQNSTPRPFVPRPTSCRDKDMQFTLCHRNHSRERDHRGAKSKERERGRDGELPSAASQTVARDRAIQQKRRQIDEVYYQECEIFGQVVKMLIEKDPSLEGPIQSSLQENLRDIGKRCVEAMKKFIEDYDSKELSL